MSGLRAKGQHLITELKQHIMATLRSQFEPRMPVHWKELQRASGLEIIAPNGGNVWEMGFLTLLIELFKEGKVVRKDSDSNSRRTEDWESATVVLSE